MRPERAVATLAALFLSSAALARTGKPALSANPLDLAQEVYDGVVRAWASATVGDAEVFELGTVKDGAREVAVRVRLEVAKVEQPQVWVTLRFAAADGSALTTPALVRTYVLPVETLPVDPRPPAEPPLKLAAFPAQRVGNEEEVRAVHVTRQFSHQSHEATWLYPAAASYLTAGQVNTVLGDARLVELVHGRGGPGGVPAGAVSIDSGGALMHRSSSMIDARRPAAEPRPESLPTRVQGFMGTLVTREPDIPASEYVWQPSLVQIAAVMLQATNLRAGQLPRGHIQVHGHSIETIERTELEPETHRVVHKQVWAADPFDPALEGAPWPFRFRPLYDENIEDGLPSYVYQRKVTQLVDWSPAK